MTLAWVIAKRIVDVDRYVLVHLLCYDLNTVISSLKGGVLAVNRYGYNYNPFIYRTVLISLDWFSVKLLVM